VRQLRVQLRSDCHGCFTARSSEKLFFGNTAQAVLERAKCSVMFLTDVLAPQQSQKQER